MCYLEIGLPYYYLSFQLTTNKRKAYKLLLYQASFQVHRYTGLLLIKVDYNFLEEEKKKKRKENYFHID